MTSTTPFVGNTMLTLAESSDLPPVNPDSYVNNVWQAQNAIYDTMWDYYSGNVFDETLTERTDDLKYPLKVNLFKRACINHRSVLFGEFDDKVLSFQCTPDVGDGSAVEKCIDTVWSDSHRNTLLLEGGLLAEVFGGIIYRIVMNPITKRLKYILVQPTTFFPVWDPDDYHNLLEVFVGYLVDVRTAVLRYNVDLDPDYDTSSATSVMVQEHWTQDGFEFTVDGKPCYWDKARKFPIKGPNIFIDPDTGRGILPYEYFPIDRAGSFYGVPLGIDATAMQDEFNKRAADIGDAVMEATHKYKFLRNRHKGRKGLERLDRVGINDLGMPAPGQKEPDIFTIGGGELPSGAVEWTAALRDMVRDDMHSPAVAHGEDEGSQRSALTLSFRMWPTTSKVRITRGLWNECFRSLHRKTLIMAMYAGGYNIRGDGKMYNYNTETKWSRMLPRDREQAVNEVVTRKQEGLISLQHGLELLEAEDTKWVEEEMARIKKDAAEVAKQEAKLQQQQFDQQRQLQDDKIQQSGQRQAGAKPPKVKEN